MSVLALALCTGPPECIESLINILSCFCVWFAAFSNVCSSFSMSFFPGAAGWVNLRPLFSTDR